MRILKCTLVVWIALCGVACKQNQAPLDPNSLTEAISLLDGYRGNGAHLQRAKLLLDAVVKERPDHAKAHRELARYYIMAGHINRSNFRPGFLEAAEAELNLALDIAPDFIEAHVLGGHLYYKMGRKDKAKDSLRKAEALGASDEWFHNNWADILSDEGNYSEAIRHYQTVVESETKNKKAKGFAIDGLSDVYTRSGRFHEAETMYKLKIDFEPRDAWSHNSYAHFLLCKLGDSERSIEQSELALEIMNFGAGRMGLAAGRYVKWAENAVGSTTESSLKELQQIFEVSGSPPEETVRWFCGDGEAFKLVSGSVKNLKSRRT